LEARLAACEARMLELLEFLAGSKMSPRSRSVRHHTTANREVRQDIVAIRRRRRVSNLRQLLGFESAPIGAW